MILSLVLVVPHSQATDNEEMLLKSALQSYQNGELKECAKRFYALAKANPQKGLYWFNLGNCLFMGEAYAKANRAFDKVIQLQSPLAPAAVLNQARSYEKLGNKEKSRWLLLSLRDKTLPPNFRRELALEYYDREMYLETQRQLLQLPRPLDSKSKLLLGLCLIKQNKPAQAEKVFKNLSNTTAEDLSAADRATVQQLLSSVKSQSNLDRNYGLYLDLAYGSTSNASLEGRSYEPISSPLIRGSLGTHYRFFQSGEWSQKLTYGLDFENPTEQPQLSTQTHTLQIPVMKTNRDYELVMTPYYSVQLWDQSMVSQKTGAYFRAGLLNNQGWGGGVDGDVSSQKSVVESLSYLTGSFYSVRPYVNLSLSTWYLQLSWVYGSDGTQDIVYSDGSRLPLQHTYQGPGIRTVWRATTSSTVSFQVLALQRSYKNNSLPADKQRLDQEINASLKYSYGFGRGWTAYGLVEYNPNKSTLGSDDVRDKNYDNTNMLVGFSWDVF